MKPKLAGASDRIDHAMQAASEALVRRRYFECQRLCLRALAAAHRALDYERMARILLPLQEARRHTRDLATDSGAVFVLSGPLPQAPSLRPGCYLLEPPRVGMDGALLRQALDAAEIPALVLTREPLTRSGLWPVVAHGPVTIRVRVPAPARRPEPWAMPEAIRAHPHLIALTPARPRALDDSPTPTPTPHARHAPPVPAPKPTQTTPRRSRKTLAPELPTAPEPETHPAADVPPVTWFIHTAELLGDEAIASVAPARPAAARVEELLQRLESHPDHEKLHQRLQEACRAAVHEPPPARTPAPDPDDDHAGDHAEQHADEPGIAAPAHAPAAPAAPRTRPADARAEHPR